MSQDNTALYWADRIVEQIKQRIDSSPILQEIVKEKGIICYDEKTPSGRIHIGSGRGWVINDIIAKALRSKSLKGRFILSSDDMDPMDDLPKYLDSKKFKQYMGIPFRNIPFSDDETYAQHFFKDVTSKFSDYGINAELESTGDRYIRGDFNDVIKEILDNADKIQEIYRELYGDHVKATKKLPFNPICEKCGKIGTTVATHWDQEREILSYECKEDHVKWAKGCGYKGEISPYNGNGKFPWKVEWATKWKVVGVTYETAGKDHFSAGGSRDISTRIATRILNFPSPLPSEGESTGKGYEFFNVGGLKMSSSKGTGASFSGMTNYAPGYILRYILAKTYPTTAIDFQFTGSNHLLLYYDQYDQTERIYYDQEILPDSRDNASQKRLYELAHIGSIEDKMPIQIPFRTLLDVAQVTNDDEIAFDRIKAMGKITGKITKDEKNYIIERISYARRWAPNAPDNLRFSVTSEPVIDVITDSERMALLEVADMVVTEKTEESIKLRMGEIMKKYELKAGKFFKIIYKIVFGKSKGPRLIPFIFTYGQEEFANLIKNALNE